MVTNWTARSRCINRQAFHLHNFQGVGCWAGAGAQDVVEDHAAIDYVFSEVVVFDFGEGGCEFCEFQVVGGDEAEAVLANEG